MALHVVSFIIFVLRLFSFDLMLKFLVNKFVLNLISLSFVIVLHFSSGCVRRLRNASNALMHDDRYLTSAFINIWLNM